MAGKWTNSLYKVHRTRWFHWGASSVMFEDNTLKERVEFSITGTTFLSVDIIFNTWKRRKDVTSYRAWRIRKIKDSVSRILEHARLIVAIIDKKKSYRRDKLLIDFSVIFALSSMLSMSPFTMRLSIIELWYQPMMYRRSAIFIIFPDLSAGSYSCKWHATHFSCA